MPLPNVTGFPGPLSVFIPAFQGKQTANLITSYARDPKKFLVNKLPTRTPTPLMAGNFLQLRPEALARTVVDPNAAIWVDGQMRPAGTHNQQDYRAVPYVCQRRNESAYLGWQTRDQAVWPIQDTQLGALGHLMMTRRTQAFYALAMASANHITTGNNSHVRTANQWSSIGGTGGFFSAGTSTNPIIKRALLQVGNSIRKSTLAAVDYSQLTLVITPGTAIAMSTSAEIHDYLARNPLALAQVRGDSPSQNGQWGLPDKLYGLDLAIDATLRTTSPRLEVPGSFSDILSTDDNTALVMTTPGAMGENVGQVNSAFSSVHMFVYNGEEMVVETQDEPWHKRTLMAVSETYTFAMVSPESAALITNLFS